ncbi:MAG: galactose mutarotase [Ferruginibacter sp.]|uniref:aldose epimerase family protein n=1 Tax=Ferruginibacter sp. TaxID=1940288 RepID=UPI0026599652|nr:aldose epimerase family protein [Ferruginibacter sp.]MDB5276111.1 galactose mutarotase [Ferruginibacter sp.]
MAKPTITCTPAENRINGEEVLSFVVSNDSVEVTFTNYGCTIMSVLAPDKNGHKKNIVSGFARPADYLNSHPYFGCVVGRFANRIAFGKFTLNNLEYQLPVNNGPNHLHGGIAGFDKKVWRVKNVISDEDAAGVAFSYTSADMEEGYPGKLEVTITYSLNANNELILQYEATCDQPTIINLTNHSYFNLSGFSDATVDEHLLKINAKNYTKKNEHNVPSGEIAPVENTPLDFREYKRIGQNINELITDKGYDHNFVLQNSTGAISLVAELQEPVSGRLLQVLTNQPGIQVYTANWWDGSITGVQGVPYLQHGAIALETQNFPDAPNHSNFPSAALSPGEVYNTTTTYRFTVI